MVAARMPLRWPLAALAAFAGLLALVVGGWAPLDRLDADLSAAARGYGTAHPGVVAWVRIATDVAATVPFLVAGGAAAALLAARRDRMAAVWCAGVTVVVPLLWSVLHLVLHRPRPVAGFVTVTSNGFPSGHSANAAAAGLVAVLLFWHRLGSAGRVAAVLAAGSFTAFVGVTRVLLVVHWPADVLGGWLLSGAVVPLVGWAVTRLPAGRPTARRQPPSPSGPTGVPGRSE
ncbi:MAG TPA: phosphatase PAP2 family protein [Catenuloplanes sp.]|jgi:undecaprenyl-diphosphatase